MSEPNTKPTIRLDADVLSSLFNDLRDAQETENAYGLTLELDGKIVS
jgi:hypothetical protein